MANVDELLKGLLKNDVAKGVAIGVGVAAAVPILAVVAKPAARSMMRTGILFFEKGREFLAAAEENFEDMVAEVKSELAEDRRMEEGIAAAGETVGAGDFVSPED
ncbi:DUF5132 domain-containing protein [Methylomagnum sp.]